MLDSDLVHRKISTIQNCLQSIKTYTDGFDVETLTDLKTQDSVVLNLERAIQSCVDICMHIASVKSLGTPASMKEAFYLLCDNKIISKDRADNLAAMVGFRNIAVHSYEDLSLEILQSIVSGHIKDFEDFFKEILIYMKN